MRPFVYLGGVLIALLCAMGLQWASEHYRARPEPPRIFDDPRLSFHHAKHLARNAVRQFKQLPQDQQRALRTALLSTITTLADWSNTHVSKHQLICLGERHEPDYRAFIARRVLPYIDYQILMLETSRGQLQSMCEGLLAGERASLLRAPIGGIVKDALSREPVAQIVAIDEYQANATKARPVLRNDAVSLPEREAAIVAAIGAQWQPNKRHVILMGAFHCRASRGWMIHALQQSNADIRSAGVLGTVLLARYREPSAQVLMYFLEEIGMHQRSLVIADTSRIPTQILHWLPPFADAIAGYDSAILFDDQKMDITAMTEQR